MRLPMVFLLLGGCDLITGLDDFTITSTTSTTSAGGHGGASGTEGQGPAACPEGHADCSGTCADLTTDPYHCGACNHDCSDAACHDARCQPLTLVEGLAAPANILVDSEHLVWSDSDRLTTASLGGAHQRALAAGPGVIRSIAMDTLHVYWTNAGTGEVLRASHDGSSPPESIASDQLSPDAIALHADRVHWTDPVEGSLRSALKDGSAPLTEATGLGQLRTLAVDATGAYWADTATGDIMRRSPDGGTPVTLAMGQTDVCNLALDDTHLYWTSGSGVHKVPLQGGTTVTLAESDTYPCGIAVDTTTIYWTEPTAGMVMKAPLEPGAAEVIASGQLEPFGIAVDQTALYWTDLTAGTIQRLRK